MKRIIVVDDDEDFLEWIVTGLSLDGYDILTARTGDGGLEAILREKPDVAIVDINLPGMNGFDLCRRVKSDPSAAETAVILVTGVFKEVESLEEGYHSGADDFLMKPFSYEQLRVRVLRQIRK